MGCMLPLHHRACNVFESVWYSGSEIVCTLKTPFYLIITYGVIYISEIINTIF